MRRLTAVLSFGLIAGALAAGVMMWPASSRAMQAPEAGADAGAQAEQDYTMRCVACHGMDGDSQVPNMSFTDGIWRQGSSEEEVAKTIAEGVPGTAMMPFKGQLSDEQMLALARYVRKFDPALEAGRSR